MMCTIRRRIAVVGTVVLSFAALVPSANAQGSDGAGWGAEGRVGSGQSAYITRWFSKDFEVLLGGSVDYFKTDREGVNAPSSTNTNASVSLQFRKVMGSGSVRPFLGLGPSVLFSRQSTEAQANSGEQKTTTNGIGGRGEIGALVPVNSVATFGFVTALDLNHQKQKSTVEGTNINSTATNLQARFGGIQFIVSLRF